MTKTDESVHVRDAIRAILVTPSAEVLLMRIRHPDREESFWIAPGGGLEPGETVETGLRRELLEELGLTQFEIGPLSVAATAHVQLGRGARSCSSRQQELDAASGNRRDSHFHERRSHAAPPFHPRDERRTLRTLL
jgi:8-oxo-dGTP pyrophosphatase MutT (NUDIX family)